MKERSLYRFMTWIVSLVLIPTSTWAVEFQDPPEPDEPAVRAIPPQEGTDDDDSEDQGPPQPGLDTTALATPSLFGNDDSFAYVPNMYGDLFFGGGFFSGGFSTIPIAGGDRLVKIAENNRPIPTDRVYFGFQHFHNALLEDGFVARQTHLDRYTVGVEKATANRCWSLDLRIPFADGLDSVQDPITGGREAVEFGNISLAVKRLLYRDCNHVVSAGLGITLPTADDAALTNLDIVLFEIENDAVHLQPFLGWLWSPNQRFFLQAFAQMDFDTNGNRVSSPIGIPLSGNRLQDQSILMLDASAGYWAYENPCARYLTGVAPFIELHYTTTMQDADTFNGLGNPFNRMDIFNITGGLHFRLGQKTWLSVAAVAPLRQNEEKLFDAEVGLQLNRRF